MVAAAKIVKWSKTSGSKRHGILNDPIYAIDCFASILCLLKIMYKTMKKTIEFVNLDIQT